MEERTLKVMRHVERKKQNALGCPLDPCRENEKHLLVSAQWVGEEPKILELIHCDNLCEQALCLILKRLHNCFDTFEKRMGKKKKVDFLLILLSSVN